MAPTGPRSRPSQPPQRGANVRNEAFESIFGRPAVGHHGQGQGPAGAVGPPGGYGQGPGHAGPGQTGSLIPGPPPGGAYGFPPQRGPGPPVPPHHGHGHGPGPAAGAGINGAYHHHPPGHAHHPQPGFPPAAPLGPGIFAPQPQQPLPRGAPSFPPQVSQPPPGHHARPPPQPSYPTQPRVDGWASQSSIGHAESLRAPSQAGGAYNGYSHPVSHILQPLASKLGREDMVRECGSGREFSPSSGKADRPDRRASLAPSTYSTSSASFYSPTPEGASPSVPAVRRMPSGSFPNPHAYRPDSQAQAQGQGASQYSGNTLTPAQAYQNASSSTNTSAAGSIYGDRSGNASLLPSPASNVFPHRERVPSGAYGGVVEEAIGTAITSPDFSVSSHAQTMPGGGTYRPAGQRRPTVETSYGAGAEARGQGQARYSGTAQSEYVRSMDNLSLGGADDSGPGMLGDIPGIPKRGDESPTVKEFSTLAARFSGEYGKAPAPSIHSQTYNQDSVGSRRAGSGTGMHKRMASDSSIASSSAYTMRNMTALSQINPAPGSPTTTTFDPTSPDTPTGSDGGYGAYGGAMGARMMDRKSVDSTQSLPLHTATTGQEPLPLGTAEAYDARATSFSGSSTSRHEALTAMRTKSVGPSARRPVPSHTNTSINFPSPHPSSGSLSALVRTRSARRAAATSSPNITLASLPTIYPALLSKVAEVFRQVVILTDHTKDGLAYKDSFDGRTAVTILTEVIRTPDRNLALLLGRALDAQKMFHDVTYDHRLRDNPNEIYQFRERLAAPYMPGAAEGQGVQGGSPSSEHVSLARNASSSSSMPMRRPGAAAVGGAGQMPSTPESSSLQMSQSVSMSDSQFSFTGPGAAGSNSGNPTPATSMTSLAALGSTGAGGSAVSDSPTHHTGLKPPYNGQNSGSSIPTTTSHMPGADGEEDDDDLPVGVFTMLTDCYSPTCTKENLCYSINCPRRLEQMKRLNMKPTGLKRSISHESLMDVKASTLWIHSVSPEILASTSDTEKKRQEAINEVIYTERDFVRDLEYLKESWVKPLLTTDVISSTQSKREDFVRQVFWNVHDVWSTNHPLAERLTKRQKQQPVVERIGDLFLERITKFEPFVKYGAHQLFGKWEFEKEKGSNPAFQKFVDETERKPESRKLELNGYLTKPTTRLGRYPLLLGAVLKYTADDNPDKKDLEEAIKLIKAFLAKVNEESGKSENIFELAQLEGQLVFRPSEHIDLRLRDKSRELVNKGPLKRRGGNRDEIADLMGFLFDHAFLLVKPKYVNKAEQLRVYRRPIPLELLVVITPDESYNNKLSLGRGGTARLMAAAASSRPSLHSSTHSGSLTGGGSTSGHAGSGDRASGSHVPPKPDSKHGYSITIVHLGKKGYSMQLWVDTYVGRKKWLDAIDKQQGILRDRSCVFQTESITEGFFHGLRRINCISPYDNGNRMIYGTDEGVYFSNLRDPKLREPVKVINLVDVTQVDVIEDFQLLVVLHERSVSTFPLDCLDPNDPNAALKRGKRISSHTSFFKTGICLGKMLVAVVKSSTLSSTIKVMEPVDQAMRGKKQQGSFMKRLNGGNEALKLFKEFYIPTESSSVHFLKTKLCVGCTKGFEIVDLETLDMQGLLDPVDQSLDFVLKRDNVRPIAIYRVEEDFLLCYDEFAFYVNKNGWRSRPRWAIIWEGVPTAFALHYPYVIAFEPTFVEVRSVQTGDLVQIIPGNNISCLFADTPPSRINAASAPNRQMMFTPNAPGGAPGRPPAGYTPGFPPRAGFMPPPQPQPQPQQTRFLREQIIFTSDDGHVQFLKLPPPLTRRSSNSSLHPSQGQANNGMGMTMMQSRTSISSSAQPPLPPQAPPPMPMPMPPQPYGYQPQPPQQRGPSLQGFPPAQHAQQPVYGGHPGHLMGNRTSRG